MYCANCGVKLADTEKLCPLCGTEAYHPDIERPEVAPLYPQDFIPKRGVLSKTTIHIIVLTLFLIPIFTTLVCDLVINKSVSWSAYVIFSLCLLYLIFVLPYWFKKQSPAIFVPCDFVGIAFFLHFINYDTNGDWFLNFAFPIVAYLGVLFTALTVLLYYLKKGHYYIIGGFFIALGLFMDYIELFLWVSFGRGFQGWSLFPMVPLVLMGLALIVISISRSARAALSRKLHF